MRSPRRNHRAGVCGSTAVVLFSHPRMSAPKVSPALRGGGAGAVLGGCLGCRNRDANHLDEEEDDDDDVQSVIKQPQRRLVRFALLVFVGASPHCGAAGLDWWCWWGGGG